jgi:hypothetical protein
MFLHPLSAASSNLLNLQLGNLPDLVFQERELRLPRDLARSVHLTRYPLSSARFSELEEVTQDRVFRRSLKRPLDMRAKWRIVSFIEPFCAKEVGNGNQRDR